jgi:serine/threonine protein kinase/tetratricopeptide (TPR) repeat protein
MAVNRVAAFLDSLRTSQLVPSETVEQLGQSPHARGDDPAPLARELVRKGHLTVYQAKQIAKGGKDLVLGPYHILELVRQVGPAQVFKAVHSQMNCTVGLKVVRKDRPADMAALMRESEITVRLAHAAFLKAYESGETRDASYFAFEHIDGIDLEKRIQQSGPLPVREACDCIRQAALGVQHAHDRGVILRKLEPARLLLTQPGGAVKFFDLSQAHQTKGATKPPETVTGPMEFAAPELVADAGCVDPRADLYSLGCVFVYLLTGKPPSGDTPPSLPADLPPVVKAILFKLLNRRPEERFAKASEVASALVPFSKPVSAPPVPAPAPLAPSPLAPVARPAEPPPTADEQPEPAQPSELVFEQGERPAAPRKRDFSLWILVGVGMLSLGGLLALGMALDPDLNPFAKKAAPPPTQSSEVAVSTPKPEPAAPAVEPSKSKTDTPAGPGTTPEPADKGGDANIKPELKTDPKFEPKPDPKPMIQPLPKVEPKAERKPRKLMAPPDSTKQLAAERLIRQTYAADYASKKSKASDYVAIANKFLKEGTDTDDNPTVQYVLFREAGDMAARGGDLELVFKCLDEMAERFAVNILEMKMGSLTRASQGTLTPAAGKAIAEVAVELAGDAVDAENYGMAARLLEIAEPAAKKSTSPALLTHVQKLKTYLTDLAQEYAEAQIAMETLKSKPLDPAASLKWGRFQAFFKGNWGVGLPLLARGSDDALAELANKDLANPDTAANQLRMADLWYDFAATLTGQPKKQVLLRATAWYEAAAPGLAGFNKTRVEKRLKELEQQAPKDEYVLERGAVANVTITEKYNRFIAGGQYAFRGGNYARAADAFTEALKLKPDDSKATDLLKQAKYYNHLSAGYLLANLGQLNQAATQFEQALEQKPGDTVAQGALTALSQAGNSGSPFGKGKGKGK